MPPKQSPFMCFAMEWKYKYGKGMSMKQTVEEAGKIWKDMDSKAREPYMDKVRDLKTGSNQRREKAKYTCTGRTINEVNQEKEDLENKERRMKRYIESVIRNSMKDNTLLTQKYYFIMVNYFVQTINNYFIPAEVAVSEFTIKNGISRTYHTMINPGKEIFGHHYDAISHTQATHRLPLPPNALGKKNLGEVYNDILRFIYDEETESYGPVYTENETIPIVQSVLNFIQADPSARDAEIPIYSLQYLLFILKDAASEINDDEKIESCHIIAAYLENDFFEYEGGISCNFHEEIDNSKYCALSRVVRWGYAFCDLLCKHLAVDLVPGRHCPAAKKLNAIIIEPDDTESIQVRNMSRGSNIKRKNHSESESDGASCSYADVASCSSNSRKNNNNQYNYENYPKLGNASQKQYSVKEEDARQSKDLSNLNEYVSRGIKVKKEGSSSSKIKIYGYDESDSDEYTDTASHNIWSDRLTNIPPTPDNSFFDFDSATTSQKGIGRGFCKTKNDNYRPQNGMGRGGCPF